MGLPEIERYRVRKLLEPLCEYRVPPFWRRFVRLDYRIRGNKVLLFLEQKAAVGSDRQLNSAQFEYDPASRRWSLYRYDNRNRRRPYEALPCGQDLSRLVAEVDADPAGTFWN